MDVQPARGAHLAVRVYGPDRLVLQIAVAAAPERIEEQLVIRHDATPAAAAEVAMGHGGRAICCGWGRAWSRSLRAVVRA